MSIPAKLFAALLLAPLAWVASATPFIPKDDDMVLAEVAPGTRHAELATRELARERIDVALPLARLYIKQARTTGDLRFLGYADAVLEPWVRPNATSADALVLHATVLQSRHEFSESLAVLERARLLRPNDAQAWLTTATVLRVLGRYDQSLSACQHLALRADNTVGELCIQSIRALTGDLPGAYAAIRETNTASLPDEVLAWRNSELGEMAVRLGRDVEAEHWFVSGLRSNPGDFYMRAAYADLLLRNRRPQEALTLLRGQDTLEPLLLRIAIAQKMLRDSAVEQSAARLAAAFAAEAQRGDGVHLREEARFLLEVSDNPRAALTAAEENWNVQHEVDDVLVLLRAARAAGVPQAGSPARAFVRENRLQDVRVAAAMESQS